jgi:hypothetical protein
VISATSRYALVGTAQLTTGGRTVNYLRRRLLPAPESLAATGSYLVRAGDRIDVVSWQVYGDPELFWRLADGNGAMDPAELTATAGRLLRVTLPLGVPGG